jgi:hypothetical protein
MNALNRMTNEELEKLHREFENKTEFTHDESVLAAVVDELLEKRIALKKLEEIALEHWKTELKQDDEEPHESGFSFIRYVLVTLSREYGFLRPLEKVMDEQEEKLHHHYGSFGAADRLRYIFRNLERKAEQSQFAYRALKEDMLVWARAIGLAAGMAANGGTHREINARMRGLIEMIESAVTAIRNANEDERHGFYGAHVPDVFRSDYPVREYNQRIHELERELELERKRNSGDGLKAEDLF